jgi:hypothetical protein
VLPSSANGDNPFFAPKRIPDQEGVGPFKLPWDPDVWVLGFWGFGAAQKNKKKNTSVAIICKQRQFFFFSRQKGLQIRKVSFRSNFRGTPMFGFWGFGFFDADRTKKNKKKEKNIILILAFEKRIRV